MIHAVKLLIPEYSIALGSGLDFLMQIPSLELGT
jgi:hypothetical protein